VLFRSVVSAEQDDLGPLLRWAGVGFVRVGEHAGAVAAAGGAVVADGQPRYRRLWARAAVVFRDELGVEGRDGDPARAGRALGRGRAVQDGAVAAAPVHVDVRGGAGPTRRDLGVRRVLAVAVGQFDGEGFGVDPQDRIPDVED